MNIVSRVGQSRFGWLACGILSVSVHLFALDYDFWNKMKIENQERANSLNSTTQISDMGPIVNTLGSGAQRNLIFLSVICIVCTMIFKFRKFKGISIQSCIVMSCLSYLISLVFPWIPYYLLYKFTDLVPNRWAWGMGDYPNADLSAVLYVSGCVTVVLLVAHAVWPQHRERFSD